MPIHVNTPVHTELSYLERIVSRAAKIFLQFCNKNQNSLRRWLTKVNSYNMIIVNKLTVKKFTKRKGRL